jgi:hypothetical protein
MIESRHAMQRRRSDTVHSLEREEAHQRLLARLAAGRRAAATRRLRATPARSDCCRGAPPAPTGRA